MKLSDFVYNLPEHLIAKYPTDNRSDSRLLEVINPENLSQSKPILNHKKFKDISDLFNPGDLLVLNNTKVMPARFYGFKATGAKLEFLVERILDHKQALVHIKANRAPKPDSFIDLVCNHNCATQELKNPYQLKVVGKSDNLYIVELVHSLSSGSSDSSDITWEQLLNQIGSMPLPPYINRNLSQEDQTRYQTVYAQNLGAVAAPTAGLHFDQELLNLLKDKGVIIKYITLHVGSGTFAPVRVDNIKDHKMHSEYYSVDSDLIQAIIENKNNKKSNKSSNKIIAVGTTSLRCLESLAQNIDKQNYNQLIDIPKSGDTDIFIYPGFEFKIVDSLITNFHLPGSTLMMLVSAFAGSDTIRYTYQQAIDHEYRFFSYGDAMWLNKKL